jgi:hypothetical protein
MKMKIFLYILLSATLICQCSTTQKLTKNSDKNEDTPILQGFVFINISNIYYHGGALGIYDKNGDTLIYVKNKNIKLDRNVYETIEEDYLYKKNVKVESFDPEYGLFILRCYGIKNNYYEVGINDTIGLISTQLSNDYIEFKDVKKYIMDSHPIPTSTNPLRINPEENSEITKDFEQWTFIPIEINGDWLKVKDNKECYKGATPSEKDIIGWVRWQKDGVFILKVAHVC